MVSSTGEGQAGPDGVADRLAVPQKPGNTGGGSSAVAKRMATGGMEEWGDYILDALASSI